MSSQFLNQLLTEVLNVRPLKEESVDTILKHVLFIRTRNSEKNHQKYEKTPSCQDRVAAPLDEILERQRAIDLVKALLDNLANQRTIIGQTATNSNTTTPIIGFDEIFAQNKFNLICNCSFYVNAFYNHHPINSVDTLDLAIVCIWLATKVNSNFKRLDKILLTAKNIYKVNLKSDRSYYIQLESQILQSLGFDFALADDYPQRYILNYNQYLAKTCEAFKANLKVKTTFEVGLQLANSITWLTPLPLNRESSHLAAACLFVANKFNRILNRDNWWQQIEGCKNLDERTLFMISDLIYDVLKYHRNGWSYQPGVNCMLSVLQQGKRENLTPAQRAINLHNEKVINSPFSNYSNTSNQTSGFISNGSSPHSSMVSLPSMMSPCSTTSGFSINKMLDPDEIIVKEEQNISKSSQQHQGNFQRSLKNSGSQINNNFDMFDDIGQTKDPRRDKKGYWDNVSGFSRPERIPSSHNIQTKNRRQTIGPSTGLISSTNPSSSKLQIYSKKRKISEQNLSPASISKNHYSENKRIKLPQNKMNCVYRGSPRPERDIKTANLPQQLNNNRFGGFLTGRSGFDFPVIHEHDQPLRNTSKIPDRKREPSASSSHYSLSSQISLSSLSSQNTSIASSPGPNNHSLSQLDLNRTLTTEEDPHPNEQKYKNRMEAIMRDKQVLCHYLHKKRYKLLSKEEKNVVKSNAKHLKEKKREKERRRTTIGV